MGNWVEKKNAKGEATRYYRIRMTVGHHISAAGIEVADVVDFYGRTKKEAEAKKQKYIANRESGATDKKQYFSVLADQWLETVFPNYDFSVSTKQKYVSAWERMIKPQAFYNRPLEEVTALTLQEAINEIARTGGAMGTLKCTGRMIRLFYDYLEKYGIYKNVGRLVEIPKRKTKPLGDVGVWTPEEVAAILGNFDKADNRFRLRFLLVLAYFTGGRIGELLALRYDDISAAGVRINKQVQRDDSGAMTVKETKTAGSVRVVPISDPRVFQELKLHRDWHAKEAKKNKYPLDYIFTTETGAFYEKHNITRAVERYYKRIGIELNGRTCFHTFRHTFGTTLADAGVRLEYTARLMGHSGTNTTTQYYINQNAALAREYVGALSKGLNTAPENVVLFTSPQKNGGKMGEYAKKRGNFRAMKNP